MYYHNEAVPTNIEEKLCDKKVERESRKVGECNNVLILLLLLLLVVAPLHPHHQTCFDIMPKIINNLLSVVDYELLTKLRISKA